jgi:N-acetylmuramoyl-L-alanine amidase
LPVLLTAFQRHWRPERVDGLADTETRGLLRAVVALSND